jgi:hypothetical protein
VGLIWKFLGFWGGGKERLSHGRNIREGAWVRDIVRVDCVVRLKFKMDS